MSTPTPTPNHFNSIVGVDPIARGCPACAGGEKGSGCCSLSYDDPIRTRPNVNGTRLIHAREIPCRSGSERICYAIGKINELRRRRCDLHPVDEGVDGGIEIACSQASREDTRLEDGEAAGSEVNTIRERTGACTVEIDGIRPHLQLSLYIEILIDG